MKVGYLFSKSRLQYQTYVSSNKRAKTKTLNILTEPNSKICQLNKSVYQYFDTVLKYFYIANFIEIEVSLLQLEIKLVREVLKWIKILLFK